MHIKRKKGWQLPESQATREEAVLDRRAFLIAGGTAAGLAGLLVLPRILSSPLPAEADPTADLYPVKPNKAWVVDRPITPEAVNTTYNNFYEFGSHKEIHTAAQALRLRPWTVKIDGLVEKPFEIGIDDLIRRMPLEERVYRHRCVEAWSMVVPWTGFPLAALVKLANPLSSAKFVRFETFHDPSVASGQTQTWYPWPYVEGITMAEATNELALLVTGAYGKPLHKQMGAPMRLHLPWKYGFKSIKSIKRVSFTDQRPVSFWESFQGQEYGFWANVNPQVPHARWSQATERVLGTDERIPTELYNGYGEWVAHLYKDITGERLFT